MIPYSVVAKPTGAACNLDCTYCFFLSKELLYDVKRQQMSEETLEIYLRELLASHPDGDVLVPWQGGEPTMRGLDFFRRAIEITTELARPGQKVSHTIQTNGTLLTDEWGEFLAENKVLVGISIDGPADIHDAYRVNKAGRATYAAVRRGWDILAAHGVERNILCTVHAANQHRPLDVYHHFRDDLGAQFIQFIPIVERVHPGHLAIAEAGWSAENRTRLLYKQDGDAVTSRSVAPRQWGSFLSTIFDEWVRRDVGRVFVQHFDTALASAFDIPTLCVHAPECGRSLAIEFNGDIYSCDHYVEPDYLLGNVREGLATLVESERQRDFGRAKRRLPKWCISCPVRSFCHSGCPKDRFLRGEAARELAWATVDDAEPPLNYLCAGYRSFFTHIRPHISMMARLIRSGRPATDIMAMAAAASPEPEHTTSGPAPTTPASQQKEDPSCR